MGPEQKGWRKETQWAGGICDSWHGKQTLSQHKQLWEEHHLCVPRAQRLPEVSLSKLSQGVQVACGSGKITEMDSPAPGRFQPVDNLILRL